VANLYTCEHPIESNIQCTALTWRSQPAQVLQVCALCGSHRWLPGGWVRPRMVEEAALKILAEAKPPL
jgi:hypothetical protein